MESEDVIRERIRSTLVSLRKSKDFTQEQIGDMVGKSKTAIASWEQGKSLPGPETLYRLAMIYGVTMGQIYGEKEENADVKSIQEAAETAAEATACAGEERGRIEKIYRFSASDLIQRDGEAASDDRDIQADIRRDNGLEKGEA